MSDTTSSVRHLFPQVFANGYVPIPNVDKACGLPKWTTIRVDERQVKQWARQKRWPAIGIRIEPPLIVIDIDILDAELAAALDQMVPAGALGRVGEAPKVARFLRYEGKPFIQILTRNWKPPEGAKKWSKVEIFAGQQRGSSKRQFGAFGPHSHDKATGEVLLTYAWPDGRNPANTPIGDLPVIGYEQVLAIVDAAERLFDGRGWLVDRFTRGGEVNKVRVYDLTPDMKFVAGDGAVYDLTSLESAAIAAKHNGIDFRITGSFTGDPNSAGAARRCMVRMSHHKRVCIVDNKTSTTHHPIDANAAEDMEKLAELGEFIKGGIMP